MIEAERTELETKLQRRDQQLAEQTDELQGLKESLAATRNELTVQLQLVDQRNRELQDRASLLRSQQQATQPFQPTGIAQIAASIMYDDLTRIDGIGPATERKLIKAGFTQISQIAELNNDQTLKLAETLKIKNVSRVAKWVQLAADQQSSDGTASS